MKKLSVALIIVAVLAFSGITAFAAEAEESVSAYAAEISEDSGIVGSSDYPVITRFENVTDGVSISWNSYSGAAKYALYVKTGGTWKSIAVTASTSYTHRSVASGESVTYTVRAMNGSGKNISGYNSSGYTNVFYAPPVIKSAASVYGGVEVTWNAAAGGNQYALYRKNGSSWAWVGATDKLKLTDSGVSSGTGYTYALRLLDNSRTKALSGYSAEKTVTYLSAPEISKIENYNADSSKIYWNKISGVYKYRVYMKNGSRWVKLGETTDGSYIHKGLADGQAVVYTVRGLDRNNSFVTGFNGAGKSNTFYTCPDAPELSNVYTGVQVKWKRRNSFEYYRVCRKTSGGKWTTLGDVKGLQFIDKTPEPDTVYSYAVRVVNSSGDQWVSSLSSTSEIRYIKSPSVSSFENINGGVKIKWSESKGAAKYRVYSKNGSGWTKLSETTDLSFTDKAVTEGAEKVYTVRALDKNNNMVTGFKSDGWQFTYYAPITFSSVKYSNNAYTIKWSKNDAFPKFRVYRRTVATGWKSIGDTTGTSFTDSTAQKNTAYTYCVRAFDNNARFLTGVGSLKYYYNGSLATGQITEGGKSYYLNNGVFRSGYQTIGGKKYYYNSSGELQKNTIVGSKSEGYYYADKNGVCCVSEEMRLAAEFMMKYCTGNTLKEKMKSGFMYLANHFPYSRTYDHPKKASDIAPLAIDMFTKRKGNCFRYAACFTCIAKLAGYRARTVIGLAGSSPHGWSEVLVDGKWLICDPDAQLPNYHVAPYRAYMMRSHYWALTTFTRCEVEINDGKAIWK